MKNDNNVKLKKELSLDFYGRYKIPANIIEMNRKDGQKVCVLDVGGRGNLLKEFLPEDEVYCLDPGVDGKSQNFISGRKL